jgi:4-hydroxy-2-oxoheptanedioate aldolase
MTIPNGDIRAFWKAGGVALGGWMNIPDGFVAEIMARAGWDTITLDIQHGLLDYDSSLRVLQGIAGSGVIPLARLPWNEPGLIMKMLDAGCMGLICPMISTRADTEQFVGACLYPPLGYRSVGPARASLLYGADYAAWANEQVAPIALIETREAIENIADIAATPGLAGMLIGPTDLTRSLTGEPRPLSDHPTVADAITRVFDAAKSAGLPYGIYTLDEADTARFAKRGCQYLPYSSDSRLFQAMINETVARLRKGIAGER